MNEVTKSNFLIVLSHNASTFEMSFFPRKREILLQDWSASTPKLTVEIELFECVDSFTYPGFLINLSGLMKSWHEFGKPLWFLSTCITYGVGQMTA